MKKRLFKYAVLFHEYEMTEGKRVYKDSKLIIEPTNIVAKDDKEIAFKVTRLIPDQYAEHPEDVEILITNF